MGNDDFQTLFDEVNEWIKDFEKKNNIITENKFDEFKDDCELIYGIAKEYADKSRSLIKSAKNNTVRTEYGIGGESIHRGPYCPSLIEDIVIGNVNRGRIAKRVPQKPSYTFSFDKNGDLIAASGAGAVEMIIRDGEKEIGVSYDEVLDFINGVSYCEYNNGRLTKYVLGNLLPLSPDDIGIHGIKKEIYGYTENEMTVDWHYGRGYKENWTDDRHLYRFPLENGHMTGKYVIRTFPNESVKKYWKEKYGAEKPDTSEFDIPEKLRRKV